MMTKDFPPANFELRKIYCDACEFLDTADWYVKAGIPHGTASQRISSLWTSWDWQKFVFVFPLLFFLTENEFA
jgi:hypothetical protein